MPKNDYVIDQQMITLRNEKTKTKAIEKFSFEIRNKDIPNRPATLFEILLVRNSPSKDQIKKQYHKLSLLTHPDADGDK